MEARVRRAAAGDAVVVACLRQLARGLDWIWWVVAVALLFLVLLALVGEWFGWGAPRDRGDDD